jgi:protein transport protein SEC24
MGAGDHGQYGAVPNAGVPGAYAGGMPGMAGPGSATGAALPPGAAGTSAAPVAQTESQLSLPGLEDMDTSLQCNSAFLRSSCSTILNAQNLAHAAKVPMGIFCQPMAGDVGTTNPEVDVVDFGNTGIVRCKRCRTYINPFVSWVDNGRRWKCNMCGLLNDVPSSYFSHLDSNGQRRDRDQRPELSRCSVEFIAPGDYMVRPPVPPVYFFVIDVSASAHNSGMLHSTVAAIKRSLDRLPGEARSQVGFITFDTCVHYYNLKASLQAPQMLVVSDINDIILPLPEDILVSVHESRKVIDALLDSLPAMFAGNQAVNSCTGPALTAAKRMCQHLGGKLLLFQCSLPTMGEGTLKARDNPRLLGTDKEHTLLQAEESWYKTNAVDLSSKQICVDCFLFSAHYTDLATIAQLAKITGGATYYYPGFTQALFGAKYEAELEHCLTRSTGFESVMRVRATRGLRVSNFYGNYFVRGSDLLALPNCTSDSVFGFDLAYEDAMLPSTAVTVQAALLYTTSDGERRIRVHTMLIPVTKSVPDFMDSVDIDCCVNLIAKQAAEVAVKSGMDQARQRTHQLTVDILRASKQSQQRGQGFPQQPGQQADVPTPASLQLLPLYSMSLQKSLALRGGTDVRIDERAFYLQLLSNMTVDESRVFIYPRMFSIHDMPMDAGIPSDETEDETTCAGPNRTRLPAILNLSHERLTSDGIFLMETGYDLFLWIGRSVNPALLATLFGVDTLEGADMTTISIQKDSSDFSSRVAAVLQALRADQKRYMHMHYIREGDGYAEAYFSRYLVEDRAAYQGGAVSYSEYHSFITRQTQVMG